MGKFYHIAGISAQALSNHKRRQKQAKQKQEQVVSMIVEIRTSTGIMGIKKTYHLLKDKLRDIGIGRDKFYAIYRQNGFVVERRRRPERTTYSDPRSKFANLTIDKKFDRINQLWATDITYIRLEDGKFAYLTMIIDVVSRRILSYKLSLDMLADNNVEALKKALKLRQKQLKDVELIHHSDRGSQFVSQKYLKILERAGVKVSMAYSVYENIYIERINGIIKQEYIYPYKIRDFKQLEKHLQWAIDTYNNKRPHWSLGLMTPVEFEQKFGTGVVSERFHLTFSDYSQNTQNVKNHKQTNKKLSQKLMRT